MPMALMQGECKMKQTDLGTIGSGLVNQWQTGKPHGETGSGAITLYKDRDPMESVNQYPDWLLKIVPSSTLFLVTYINMKRRLPETTNKSEAMTRLEELLHIIKSNLEPADPQAILHALEAVASVFKTALPNQIGLKVYLSILKDMPVIALQNACINVCATHKYPNMPLPSAFLDGGGPSKFILESVKNRTEVAINNLRSMQ
jgi:hypothetical protein